MCVLPVLDQKHMGNMLQTNTTVQKILQYNAIICNISTNYSLKNIIKSAPLGHSAKKQLKFSQMYYLLQDCSAGLHYNQGCNQHFRKTEAMSPVHPSQHIFKTEKVF